MRLSYSLHLLYLSLVNDRDHLQEVNEADEERGRGDTGYLRHGYEYAEI